MKETDVTRQPHIPSKNLWCHCDLLRIKEIKKRGESN